MENFKIYHDGELDKTEFATRKATIIGSTLIEGVQAYGEQVGGAFAVMTQKIGHSLAAGLFDAFHGTNMQDQLHEQWESERRAEFAGKIGLL